MRKVTGVVKWFKGTKGIGFIESDGGGAEVFAHYCAIAGAGARSLTEGQKVEYTLTRGQKGPQAEEIIILS